MKKVFAMLLALTLLALCIPAASAAWSCPNGGDCPYGTECPYDGVCQHDGVCLGGGMMMHRGHGGTHGCR